MPLGAEVGLATGHSVLDGTQLPHGKGHSSPTPTFRPMSIVAKPLPMSATAELLLFFVFVFFCLWFRAAD